MEVHIPIGKLKTHCYQIFDQAQKDNQKLIITKRGTPIVEIIPIGTQVIKKSLLGMLSNKAKINGDILAPLETKWEAENDQ